MFFKNMPFLLLFYFKCSLIFLFSVLFLADEIVDGKVHHNEQYNINDYHHGL